MKKPEDRKIDDHEYQIYHMGPKEQLRIMKYVAKTVGKPLGRALTSESDVRGGEKKSKGILDMDSGVIGVFLETIIDSIDDNDVIEKIEKLLEQAHRKNDKGGFVPHKMESEVYHGELPHIFKVVGAVLEVNFRNFLGGSTGLVSKLMARVQTEIAAEK